MGPFGTSSYTVGKTHCSKNFLADSSVAVMGDIVQEFCKTRNLFGHRGPGSKRLYKEFALIYQKEEECRSTSAMSAENPYLKKGHPKNGNNLKTCYSFFRNTQPFHYLTCMYSDP